MALGRLFLFFFWIATKILADFLAMTVLGYEKMGRRYAILFFGFASINELLRNARHEAKASRNDSLYRLCEGNASTLRIRPLSSLRGDLSPKQSIEIIHL